VDIVLGKAKRWREEMEKLRAIVLDCGLTEELKWYQPCYTVGGGNVVLIGAFKEFCALLFCKGALVKDPENILKKPGENTQAGRRIEFTSLEQIVKMTPVLKAYICDAVAVQKSGRDIEYKKVTDHKIPAELKAKFDEDPAFKAAFKALTPGRQRAYLLHFNAAKQSATRTSRIEKYAPLIFRGMGPLDDYNMKRKEKAARRASQVARS
jgi:uncharacterized protein YdeI (YjbR/CyaY-like superfamily)